jgi:transposase
MRLLAKGMAQAEVARRMDVSRTSVLRWARARTRRRGPAWRKRPLGRPRKLTDAHLGKLPPLLKQGAQAHGYLNDLWTLPRIAVVLKRECGVQVHPSHLWRVLTRLGWSCQRPGGKAVERDEEAIARWKRYTWPALKKRPETNSVRSSSSTKAD